MKIALAIFVKTPGFSPLKTRLAAGIGKENALEFYHQSVKIVEENAKSLGCDAYWAIQEEEALSHKLWSGLNRMQSGEGDLGARQSYVYDTLLKKYDGVILIGSDSPQTSPDLLKLAIDKLYTHDFVVGPANDGGYYLFAGRVPLMEDVWRSVPWSSTMTLEVLEANLLVKPYHLPVLVDVDTEKDLALLVDDMPKQMSKKQNDLVNWIQTII